MKLICVTRICQPQKTLKQIQRRSFEVNFVTPIKQMLNYNIIFKIIVMINGDPKSAFAEKPIKMDGCDKSYFAYPTRILLEDYFGEEIESGRLQTYIVEEYWNDDYESGTALNIGDKKAKELGADFVFHWNPEILLNEKGNQILTRAINAMIEKNLFVTGITNVPGEFIPNNYASIWNIKKLEEFGGFNARNSNMGTIDDEDIIKKAKDIIGDNSIKEITISGFEYLHTLLRMYKFSKDDFTYGMLFDSSITTTDFSLLNEERKRDLKLRIFKKKIVIDAYADDLLGNISRKEKDHFYEKVKKRMISV